MDARSAQLLEVSGSPSVTCLLSQSVCVSVQRLRFHVIFLLCDYCNETSVVLHLITI